MPLAAWIQRGTEELAYHTGPSIGGLLNVTFIDFTERNIVRVPNAFRQDEKLSLVVSIVLEISKPV